MDLRKAGIILNERIELRISLGHSRKPNGERVLKNLSRFYFSLKGKEFNGAFHIEAEAFM